MSLALIVSVAVVGVEPVVASAAVGPTPLATVATSAATGTAGMFVPVQGRLMDTRNGTGGYSTPMPANSWRTVTVAGAVGMPTSGISAVQLTVTAVTPSSLGTVNVQPTGSIPSNVTCLVYGGAISGTTSSTTITALGADGKIQVKAETSVNLLLDVQGYYTSGDNAAAGGYVPLTPARLVDTRNGTGVPVGKLAAGSTTPIQMNGRGGIPDDASAVFATLSPLSTSAAGGYLTAYASDAPKPTATLNYPGNMTSNIGAVIPVGADGKINLYSTEGMDFVLDVVGYFTATPGDTGAFTPGATRALDTRVAPNTAVPANATVTKQLAGVKGVPLAGAGISAVAISMTTIHSGGAGWVKIWPGDRPEPGGGNSVNFPASTASTYRSDLIVVRPGADGTIKIKNFSSDATHVVMDVVGWYSNVASAIQNGQTRTQARVTLQAGAAGGGAWVAYQFRTGSTSAFANIPVADVIIPGTTVHPSAWPVQRAASGQFDSYIWNVASSVNGIDGLVQVRSCYGVTSTDTDPVCSQPSNIQLAVKTFGDSYATRDVGPGTLSLLTGDFRFTETDVSISTPLGALTVGRDLTTLGAPTERSGPKGVFGPGWTGGFVGPDSGSGAMYLDDHTADEGYVVFEDTDGGNSIYQATSAGATYPVTYSGVEDAAASGWTVTKNSASQFLVTDSEGTKTTWTKALTGWAVSSVNEAGAPSATTYTRDANGLPTRILAPVPTGISCTNPDTTPGCRSLTFAYTTVATGPGTSAIRLSQISYRSYDPASSAMQTVSVAQYTYSVADGRLTAYTDPRTSRIVGSSPIPKPLTTDYSYDAQGRLKTVTEPGLAPWTLNYDGQGRVSSVTRPDPSGQPANTTIIYDVPVTSAGAPIELGSAAAATWGQTGDLPTSATALFSANHSPSGTSAATITTNDWPYAELAYLDVNGREVNSASYGAGAWQIESTQYGLNGNPTWKLSAGNRSQALTVTADTAPAVAAETNSAVRARLLADTTNYHSTQPSLVTDKDGPTHPLVLDDGSTIQGRTHTRYIYDEGAPAADDPYNLLTTSILTARDLDGTDHDPIVSRTGYEPISSGDPTGWALKLPTSTTQQLAGTPNTATDLTIITRYNNLGQVVETRTAGGAAGGDARSTLTSYYTASGTGNCVNPGYSGLPCRTAPAAQPSSGSTIPTSTYQYNRYAQTTSVTETSGTTTRTTTTTYDKAGREIGGNTTATPAADGGTALPAYNIALDVATGLPVTRTAGTQTLTTEYDNLGRIVSYTDGTGTVTTTSYDIAGRTTASNDGKAVASYTYDDAGEHRNLVTSMTDSQAGTFTVTYDPDSNPKTTTYPGELTAWNRYDNAGNHQEINYAKNTQSWLFDRATYDASGRIRGNDSTQSSKNYTYDHAGRLVTATDLTTTGGGATQCRTRSYSLDKDANRLQVATYSDTAGTCTTSTAPAITASTFDTASRLTNTGYTYDNLGRTRTIPSVDANGIGANSTVTGALTIGYYTNDLIASQTQGTRTRTFTLDPQDNRIATMTDGTTTSTNHYSDNSDSPSWTQTGSNWDRYVSGPDAGLAAIITNTGAAKLQLVDIRGNVAATVDPTATTLTDLFDATEYGVPRDSASTPTTYSWLGQHQRSTDTLGGLTLMGVRLYNPTTGRFTTTDPIPGGNTNPYIYPSDPVNSDDLSGKCWSWISWITWACNPYFGGSRSFAYGGGSRSFAYAGSGSSFSRGGGGSFPRGQTSGGGSRSFDTDFAHRKRARKSTSDKHSRGERRLGRDQAGEKGDKRRSGNLNKRHKKRHWPGAT